MIRYKIRKDILRFSCLLLVFFTLLMIPYISHSDNSSKTSLPNPYYLIIGKVDEAKLVSGSSALSKEYNRDTNGILRISVPAPICYKMLRFKEYNLFFVSDGITTNINLGKEVALMFDGGYPINIKEKYLFYAERYYPPEEFIKKHNLQNHFVLKIMANKWPPLHEGTIDFIRGLKKHGISPSVGPSGDSPEWR